MKKILLVAILAASATSATFLFSCSVDDVKETKELSVSAKEEKTQIVLSQDWPEIETKLEAYAKDNGLQPRRFGIFCYTKGINYAFVWNDETQDVYKVTYQGGLNYSIEKVSLGYAQDQCIKHRDHSYYID